MPTPFVRFFIISNHYCPVKVGESFLEIAEIKSFMSSFESQRTWTNANQRAVR